MDKLTHYRNCIQQILEQHDTGSTEDIENILWLDRQNDRYQLQRIGWRHLTRIYYTVIHLEIRDSQIWLQHNATESDLAADLVALGVPKEDIVLGMQPTYKRPYTGYGIKDPIPAAHIQT